MKSDLQIKIISEPSSNNDYYVIYKPSGLPSAPLSCDDDFNAFAQLAKLHPEVLQVVGKKEIEHGLIHRIDTITEGLIVVASSQNAYEQLLELQKQNKIIKYYKAICNKQLIPSEGFPPCLLKPEYKINETYKLESFFRPFGQGHKEVRPVTNASGEAALKKLGKKVIYTTEVKILKKENNRITVECKIVNGFRHQVRCHLAWLGLPIIGDSIYNPQSKENKTYFSAYKIDINGTVFQINNDY